MREVVIASAARTPVGSFNGTLSGVTADYLGEVAIRGALERAGVDGKDVDEVIMGQILTAGGGQNPARKAARNAGCGDETPAWGMNQLCGSGLARSCARLSAHRDGRQRHHGLRRSGKHVACSARHAPAQWHEDGRFQDARHDAVGRPDGHVPRLSYGCHR